MTDIQIYKKVKINHEIFGLLFDVHNQYFKSLTIKGQT